jgi:hypothetical protein
VSLGLKASYFANDPDSDEEEEEDGGGGDEAEEVEEDSDDENFGAKLQASMKKV